MAERLLNPQQEQFLSYYLNPKSETWSNKTQSAIKAGYSQEYADNIGSLMPKWLEEALNDNSLMEKAMKNLSDFIGDSENKNLQWDATKFTLSRLGKSKFSERQEHTGADGKDLTINVIKYNEHNDSSQLPT